MDTNAIPIVRDVIARYGGIGDVVNADTVLVIGDVAARDGNGRGRCQVDTEVVVQDRGVLHITVGNVYEVDAIVTFTA